MTEDVDYHDLDDLVVPDPAGGIVTVSFAGDSGRAWVAAVNRSPPAVVTDGGRQATTPVPRALRCAECGAWPLPRETDAGEPAVGCRCTVLTLADLEGWPDHWRRVDGGDVDDG